MLAMVVASVSACGYLDQGNEDNGHQSLTIYTSMYPIYDFTRTIAGERANVKQIIPPGVEPHAYRPTAKDLIQLNDADAMIYLGAGLEQWAEQAKTTVQTNVEFVKLSEKIDLIPLEKTGHDHADSSHHESENDPHYWLDPMRAKTMAESIKNLLIKLDPKGEAIYKQRYETVVAKLNDLDQAYSKLVNTTSNKDILVSHAAFGYLAKRYGLKQIPISGISPNETPTPRKLKHTIEQAKRHDIKYIFFSKLVNTEVAEALQERLGTDPLVLNPIANVSKQTFDDRGVSYFSLMRDNLNQLKIALKD